MRKVLIAAVLTIGCAGWAQTPVKMGPIAPSSVAVGTVLLTTISGDAGAKINTAFASYSVVVVTAGNATATTAITIPNAATGVNGIPGTPPTCTCN